MNAPTRLQAALHQLLGDARLSATTLAGTELELWLIDAANMARAFNPEETRRILEEPPYWCWGKGKGERGKGKGERGKGNSV